MKTKNSSLVRRELNRIAEKNGGILNPEDVVHSARHASSPLHSKFQWDDTKAAHEHRLWQARMLIRVTVEMIPNGSDKEERVWVSLKSDQNKGAGYRSLVSVLSDGELRSELLQDALEDFQLFEKKYSHLVELAEIFKSFVKVRVKMKHATRASV